ncbi:TetR/AcrR family transcriptional regulator [Streptomyces sp. NPDC021080]|uniref:TetR/AcrR family transcriptional regulator n=1 Tax=Streptomyces sp. NPDC021080 TaxID=3365110 RepID=UPI0037BD22D3
MGRPRTFDETTALRTMREHFWSSGFHGTSTYDLMDATGLGKGSIYKAFGNKMNLYVQIFADYCTEIVSAARAELNPPADVVDASASPLHRIEQYMLSLAHTFATSPERRGCFMSKGTADLAASEEAVAAVARSAFADIAGALSQAVRDAQRVGEIDAQADPDALGWVLFSVLRGINAFAVAGMDETTLNTTVRTTLDLLPRPAA